MTRLRPRGLGEYATILWRRRMLGFLIAIAILIATYVAMATVRDVYEARASIAIASQSSDERDAIDVQVATVNQYLLSRSNLEPLAHRHSPYGPNVDSETAVNKMRRDITLDVKLREYYPQFPVSFTISFRHTDPRMAKQVADDLASFFNNTNEMMERRASEESRALDSMIAEVEARLSQISLDRAARQVATGLDPMSLERATLTSAIDVLSDKEYSLLQQTIVLKQQIAEQEKLVRTAPSGNPARSTNSYGVLLVRKAQLEAQLKDYLAQYTEKNTKVIQTRTELAEINGQLNQLDSESNPTAPAVMSPELRELRVLQRDLARLETEITITERDLARKRDVLALLPVSGSTRSPVTAPAVTVPTSPAEKARADAEIDNERNRLLNRYASLAARRDASLKLNPGAPGVRAGLFQIVDRPSIPQFPVAPNRLKLMIFAAGLALACGLTAAGAAEALRLTRIQDHRDAEFYLGAPVVALIPETLTPPESAIKRKLILLRGLGVLLFAAILVPVVAFVLKQLQVFQMLAK